MSVSDVDRLAHEPPKITLKNPDGTNERTLALHYGYGGLRLIEKRFGSVEGLVKILRSGGQGPFFDAVLVGLHCGLWQQQVSEAELEACLDSADIEKHAEALGAALELAFPQQVQAGAKESASDPMVSTGPETSTSPQLSAVAP